MMTAFPVIALPAELFRGIGLELLALLETPVETPTSLSPSFFVAGELLNEANQGAAASLPS